MKKTAAVIFVAAAALIFAGAAFAQMGYGRGYGYGADRNVNVENLKKFQKETLSLRDDLITKQAELDNEYDKTTPDTARIAELRKQIVDIQTTIQKAAEKNGLPAWGHGPGRGHHMGPGMMYGGGSCGCARW
jgi:zinc resistance-associated protein